MSADASSNPYDDPLEPEASFGDNYKKRQEEPEQWPGERAWLRACLADATRRHHRPKPPKYGTKRPIPRQSRKGPRC